MNELESVLAHAGVHLDESLARLRDIVAIPSISADPAYSGDCRRAAQWVVETLRDMGCAADLRETAGQPMVVGHYVPKGATAKTPHALFYGHYDVQPADPLDKWLTPPFELTARKDAKGVERLYGRGAADDKGQFLTFVEAARAWIAVTGSLPIAATFLIEGEEESGSPSLIPFLKANRKELSRDVALICDTTMWDEKTPAITTRLRGMVHDEVTITGPRIDLHSGSYGGPVHNPIRALTQILGALHDKHGKVTIPGFYDGVSPLPAKVKTQWAALDFSEAKFLKSVGVSIPAGEKGYSVLEQIWARPTAEVNGIYGGYQGAGSKTVLPASATAKITFRLVGDQKPDQVLKGFRAFVRARLPKDCKAVFSPTGGGNPAVVVKEDTPVIAKVARALKDEFRREPVLMGAGGSIPICRSFKDILGMDSVLAGFSLDDDAIHSPNEKYNLSSFNRGIRSWVRIFAGLAS